MNVWRWIVRMVGGLASRAPEGERVPCGGAAQGGDRDE